MKTYLDCIPCLIRQALSACRRATADPTLQKDILSRVMECVSRSDLSKAPPFTAQKIYRLVREKCGGLDVYEGIKRRHNEQILVLYPMMECLVRKSSDPLATATKLSIAGNVIDYGVNSDLQDQDIQRSIDEAIRGSLSETAMERFRANAARAKSILYIGDNAGEIVFDKLLVEQLLPRSIIYAVRGSPVINDVTRIDAEETGLNDLVEIVDSGSDVPGIILDECSKEFVECYERSDMVIAKGQGNYETLSEEKKHIFFMMKVKCSVVAADVGSPVGTMAIKESRIS